MALTLYACWSAGRLLTGLAAVPRKVATTWVTQQSSSGVTPGSSESDVRLSMGLYGQATVDVSMAERAGKGRAAKDVFVTHTVSGMQPDATMPPWMGTEVPEVRRVEGDASVSTPGVVAMGPCFAFVPSTSTAIGEGILEERPRRVGSPVRGAGAEPPRPPSRWGPGCRCSSGWTRRTWEPHP
jgi:hypothetical protein